MTGESSRLNFTVTGKSENSNIEGNDLGECPMFWGKVQVMREFRLRMAWVELVGGIQGSFHQVFAV